MKPVCHAAPTRAWGWAVQLYALRSKRSWGIGDLGDLRRFGRWSRGLGARVILINPLHAVAPVVPQEPSPYYAGSRIFRNPLYISIDSVPGYRSQATQLRPLSLRATSLNNRRIIDRNKVFELKMRALRMLWRGFEDSPRFSAFVEEGGELLEQHGLYCTLAERYGPRWRDWPKRSGPEPRRARFHVWLQWLLDEQLRRAAAEIGLIGDLAVGVDPIGEDAWLFGDWIKGGSTIGAPPDRFNTRGQNWGLAAFDEQRLSESGFEPLRTTFRSAFRHMTGLRIDHVMGLVRLFLIPHGATPREGAYLHYSGGTLFDLVCDESRRASAFVIGEDLGTVPSGVRQRMAARGMLRQKLLLFSRQHPRSFPERSLAATTTHDLPTTSGFWTGADLEDELGLNRKPNVAELDRLKRRLGRWTGAEQSENTREVVERTYRILSEAPSRIVLASIDDALGVEERPNMPGTIHTWPNWSLALPLTVEEIKRDRGPARIAAIVQRSRGGPGPGG